MLLNIDLSTIFIDLVKQVSDGCQAHHDITQFAEGTRCLLVLSLRLLELLGMHHQSLLYGDLLVMIKVTWRRVGSLSPNHHSLLTSLALLKLFFNL